MAPALTPACASTMISSPMSWYNSILLCWSVCPQFFGGYVGSDAGQGGGGDDEQVHDGAPLAAGPVVVAGAVVRVHVVQPRALLTAGHGHGAAHVLIALTPCHALPISGQCSLPVSRTSSLPLWTPTRFFIYV
jgi:hypothetical protein